jgi:hypothetical protein
MSLRHVLRAAPLSLLAALLIAGCGTLASSGPSPYASPLLSYAPGNSGVIGDTSCHGTNGP